MFGRKVTAQGVYVDDEHKDHGHKSELHPLDIVVGQVDDTQIPGIWFDQIVVQHNVALGTSMLLYRFAAASDNRAGVVQDGPPLAEFERDTSVTLALPPRPNGDPSLIPTGEWRCCLERTSTSRSNPRDRNKATSSILLSCVKESDLVTPATC